MVRSARAMAPSGESNRTVVASSTRRTFTTLDGLRGFAALAIVIRHGEAFFGKLAVPASHLAVDMFFCLSGFVLAHAYGERLRAGMGIVAFMRARFVRLYPLYVAGLVLSVISRSVAVATGLARHWTWTQLAGAAACGVLFLPTPPWGPALEYVFPLNGPTWSLFFELIANGVYGSRRRFPTAAAAVIVVASAVALGLAVMVHGTVDVGWTWPTFLGGFPRVSYSFFLGVLLYRAHRRRARRLRVPPLVLVGAMMLAFMPTGPAYEYVAATVILPALVWFGAAVEPSPPVAACFSFLGRVSYGVYVLQVPIIYLVASGLRKGAHVSPERHAPWSGLALVAALILTAWLLDRVYDVRVRRLIGRPRAKLLVAKRPKLA